MIDTLYHFLSRITDGHALLSHAIAGFLINLAVMAAGKVLKILLAFVGKRIIAKTETDLDDRILAIVNSRIIALSSVVGMSLGMRELRHGLTRENTWFLAFLDSADTVLYLITVVIVASVAIRILRTLSTHAIRAISEKQKHDQLNTTLVPLINRVITIVSVALTAIVVLEHFGQSVTSLLTILGAGSLALGLAAQDTISNMISGFIIMIDRPFRLGDRVKIPSGEVGDVVEIGLRSTKILDFDNNVLIVPNNELVKTKIINYGYPDSEVRVSIEVTVGYGTDVERMKQLLLSVASEHPDVLKDPAPEAYLLKLGDHGLQFGLYCRVAEFKKQFLTAERIRVRMLEELRTAKIEIPFPQQVVYNKFDDVHALHPAPARKKIQR